MRSMLRRFPLFTPGDWTQFLNPSGREFLSGPSGGAGLLRRQVVPVAPMLCVRSDTEHRRAEVIGALHESPTLGVVRAAGDGSAPTGTPGCGRTPDRHRLMVRRASRGGGPWPTSPPQARSSRDTRRRQL